MYSMTCTRLNLREGLVVVTAARGHGCKRVCRKVDDASRRTGRQGGHLLFSFFFLILGRGVCWGFAF